MAQLGKSLQCKVADSGIPKEFPIILTSGRLVEYEGGGEETRSNPWLAELQQDMFVEINTDGRGAARGQGRPLRLGLRAGEQQQGQGRALVTDRVGQGVAFMPFHFAGFWEGEDQRGTTRPAPTRSCSANRSTPSRPTATTP